MHLSPTSSDPERYLERTGRRPVEHLADLGVLGRHLLIGHGVWLDDAEVELILSSETAIAYCPWAYLRLGQGVFANGRHAEIVERGGRVALGCDAANAGDAIDILRTAALAAGIARDARLDPTRFGAHQVFELATIAGAEAIGLADRIGSIEVGKQADLVVHRTDTPGWTPRGDVGLQLVWGTDGRSVRDVFVAGRHVVADGKVVSIDVGALAVAAADHQRHLLERAGITVPRPWPHIDAQLSPDSHPEGESIDMEFRTLGRTGVQVSRFGLGTMVLGAWGNTDHDDCVRLINRAVDAGINLIDTADVYAYGESEEIVGRALSGRQRDEVVLATKFHNPMDDDPNHRGNSRRWIRTAVEDSLRRLRTDHIDLYQIHRPDPSTDIDETIDALTDLVRAGKIGMWGTSTFPAADLVETCWAADRRGVAAPHSEQPPYSIMCRGIEREVLPTCRRHGIGVIVWSPLSGGWLTGKYQRSSPAPAGSRAATNPDHFDARQRSEVRRRGAPRGGRRRRRAHDGAARVGVVGRAS